MIEPVAEPPSMFGTEVPSGLLLPWTWAADRLRDAHDYWVATVSTSDLARVRPHVRPMWAVWQDDALLFNTGSRAIARNLGANPLVTAHLESAHDVLILEGSAEPVREAGALRRYAEANVAKYAHHLTVSGDGVAMPGGGPVVPVFRIRPERVFAWDDEERPWDGTRQRPTRFRFRQGPTGSESRR